MLELVVNRVIHSEMVLSTGSSTILSTYEHIPTDWWQSVFSKQASPRICWACLFFVRLAHEDVGHRSKLPKHQYSVMSPESERIGETDLKLCTSSLMRYVVKVTFWVRVV